MSEMYTSLGSQAVPMDIAKVTKYPTFQTQKKVWLWYQVPYKQGEKAENLFPQIMNSTILYYKWTTK